MFSAVKEPLQTVLDLVFHLTEENRRETAERLEGELEELTGYQIINSVQPIENQNVAAQANPMISFVPFDKDTNHWIKKSEASSILYPGDPAKGLVL